MTSDTTRSNVLYLFQTEGAKELNNHIQQCLEIMYDPSRGGDEPLSAVINKEILVMGEKSAMPNSELR